MAVLEYLLPDKYPNKNYLRYVCLLCIPAALYLWKWAVAIFKYRAGDKMRFWKLRYCAPLYAVIYLLLAVLDYLTLKTGKLPIPLYHG